MSFDRLEYSTGAGSVGSLGLKSSSALTTNFSGALGDNLAKSGLSTSTITAVSNQSLSNLVKFNGSDLDLSGGYSQAAAKKAFDNRLSGLSSSTEPTQKIFNSQKGNQNPAPDVYPNNLGQEHLLIEFLEYKRPSPIQEANTTAVYSCQLPLPKQIGETFSVRLNPQDTGLLGAGVAGLESIGQELGQSFESLKQLGLGGGPDRSMKDLGNDAIGLGYQAAKTAVSGVSLGGISGEQVAGVIGQKFGAIPNPHISVFFNGVDVRPAIEFSWLFSARSRSEAEKIKKIIKEFKKRVLPPVSASSQNIMGYPQMVKLTLNPWGGDDTLPRYKKGLIESINVNYTPNGPAFFEDDKPVFVVFSFLFQEIEVWTANDYGASPVDAVGAAGETLEQLKKAAT